MRYALEPHPGSPAQGLLLYVLCPCWRLAIGTAGSRSWN